MQKKHLLLIMFILFAFYLMLTDLKVKANDLSVVTVEKQDIIQKNLEPVNVNNINFQLDKSIRDKNVKYLKELIKNDVNVK